MPARSVMRPMRPPSASISRTMCPFAIPPIAGLQDILAVSASDTVRSAVSSPRRTQAFAASQPACPAPTITTSKASLISLADAEAAEDALQQVGVGGPTGDLAECPQRLAQLERHDLARLRRARRAGRPLERRAPALQRLAVARVRDRTSERS